MLQFKYYIQGYGANMKIKKSISILIAFIMFFQIFGIKSMADNDTKNVIRIHGSDRFETAIKISNRIAESSAIVLLANAQDYPDALAGSTLSGGKYPLLFTNSDKLDDRIVSEIERLNPQMIIILGGEKSVSKEIETNLNQSYEIMRIGGADRYETMELIRDYSPQKSAIITTGDNFPDALVSAPLAISKDANIVLTPKAAIGDNALNILKKTSENLYIVGGENSITGSMKETIQSLNEFDSIKELYGDNRYSTSVKIAEEFFSDTVIIASGNVFPDSLAGSVLAGSLNAPILLSAPDKLDQSAREYLKQNKDSINNIIIVGGETALSEAVVKESLAHIKGENYVLQGDFSDQLQEFRTVSIASELYDKPDESSEVIGSTYIGQYLECYGESGGYLKVRHDGRFSYTNASRTQKISDPNMFKVVGGMLILNKKYYVPSDFAPGVHPDARQALTEMQQAIWAQGLGIYIESSYRSYWYQNTIHNNYLAMDGYYAKQYSAEPGHSEHQSGKAFDVSSYGEGLYTSFENSATFRWLTENAHKYGFILRYPYDKTHITGYIYEPWHYTYVGKPLAEQIKNSGLSVEEYFNLVEE